MCVLEKFFFSWFVIVFICDCVLVEVLCSFWLMCIIGQKVIGQIIRIIVVSVQFRYSIQLMVLNMVRILCIRLLVRCMSVLCSSVILLVKCEIIDFIDLFCKWVKLVWISLVNMVFCMFCMMCRVSLLVWMVWV